jgi:hypothetical protein
MRADIADLLNSHLISIIHLSYRDRLVTVEEIVLCGRYGDGLSAGQHGNLGSPISMQYAREKVTIAWMQRNAAADLYPSRSLDHQEPRISAS